MAAAPELRRHPDLATLARGLGAWTTAQLAQAIASRGQASLVVPGGRTPAPWFDVLSQSALFWQRVRVTLTDERWVDVEDPASNERLVRERLLRDHAAGARLTGLKNPAATAAAGAPLAWQSLRGIERPFDLVVLGMGEDGHFASLFPGDSAALAALDVSGAPSCIAVWAPAEPHERISLNLPALLQARHVVLLVTGERKLGLVERQMGEDGEALPVRALLHQRRAPVSVWWCP